MRTLLIDGDICIYQIASRMEMPINWGDDLWTLHADEREAHGRLDDYIAGLVDTLKADRAILAIKDSANWRKEILPTYKSNRADVREPTIRKALMEYVASKYEVYSRPKLEGDDVLGILATHPTVVQGDKIIVSIDKDLKTIPGRHYNPNKNDEGLIAITEAEADHRHMMQTLTGDATDGYSGCPGIGPVKAERILSMSCEGGYRESMWQAVVAAYAKAGFGEEFALTQARVARICRASDYDFKKKEVILWNPPS